MTACRPSSSRLHVFCDIHKRFPHDNSTRRGAPWRIFAFGSENRETRQIGHINGLRGIGPMDYRTCQSVWRIRNRPGEIPDAREKTVFKYIRLHPPDQTIRPTVDHERLHRRDADHQIVSRWFTRLRGSPFSTSRVYFALSTLRIIV